MNADYTLLITSEHNQRPNFMATLGALLAPVTVLQTLLAGMPQQYDLDTAIGVQLDSVGMWVGVSRRVAVPLANVYFSFDTTGLGFDQGVWQGPFDPSEGVTSLDDETYRLLIRAKIAANSWDGTVTGAQNALNDVFGSIGLLFQIQDDQDMTMIMSISGTVPNAVFLALFSGGYLPLKPITVGVTYDVTSVGGAPLFGFDTYNARIAGFDTGTWAVII